MVNGTRREDETLFIGALFLVTNILSKPQILTAGCTDNRNDKTKPKENQNTKKSDTSNSKHKHHTKAIFGINYEGQVNKWNGKIADQFGIPEQNALTQILERYVTIFSRPTTIHKILKAKEHGTTNKFEIEMLTKDGKIM